jgi:hypothetical protein
MSPTNAPEQPSFLSLISGISDADKFMKVSSIPNERGNVLLCAICTIFIISLIAANVLLNCTARYNQASNQVRSWNEALYAAESGGDIAFTEIRKTLPGASPSPIPWTGWTNSGTTYVSPVTTFGSDNLQAGTVVETCYFDSSGVFHLGANPTGAWPWYRIRSKGTSPLQGLKRTGMDDRLSNGNRFVANGSTRGDGDTLLRKIDFNYDHFIATYGPNGDGTGKALQPVNAPQIARRIELIVGAVTPFGAAVRVTTSFDGPGSAGLIDSFNSNNGAYYFAANNSSDPHYADSHSGGVAVNSPTFFMHQGPIYGNVSTNGGNVLPSNLIIGVIDNNVPLTIPPLVMPSLPIPQASPVAFNSNTTITPASPGSVSAPTTYLVSSWSKSVTFNQSGSDQTYVAVHVTSDFTGQVTVNTGVHVQVFFDGNMSVKARDLVNNTGLAANMQFYGISPTNPNTTQTIDIASPGNFVGTFYAPSAAVTFGGNPDITGSIVGKSYSGNGNTSLHYDRALDNIGEPTDYRIASYVEDIR